MTVNYASELCCAFILVAMTLKGVSFDVPGCPFNTQITPNNIGALIYSTGKYELFVVVTITEISGMIGEGDVNFLLWW